MAQDEKDPTSFLKWLAGIGGSAMTIALGWCLLTILSITSRLDKLENDMSNWGTLAELKNKQVQLEIQLEVMKQVWSYEYGRKIPDGKPTAGPPPLNPPLPPPPLPPMLDPDQFRKEQMQKYPSKK